jgi:hypothetical protein
MVHELLWLIIAKLHYSHSIGHLRVQQKMKCHRAWELDQPYRKVVRNIGSVFSFLIDVNGI